MIKTALIIAIIKLIECFDYNKIVKSNLSSHAQDIRAGKKLFIQKASIGAAMLIAGLCLSATASAQSRANVNTRVLTPLTIANTNDLNFGRIIPGTVRSTIRLGRDNGVLTVVDGDALPIGGTVERAGFTIVADPSTRVQITLPNTLNIVRVGGTETMRVNRFRLDGRGGRAARRNIDNSGILNILVSAQLLVLPTQAAGVYRANYDVTVEYN